MPDKASNEKQNLDWEDQQNQRVQVPTGLSFRPDEISGSLKKERKIQCGSELPIPGYSNGPKQFVRWMVCYLSHVLNSELIVCYSIGKKFGNQMPFGFQTFYHGGY